MKPIRMLRTMDGSPDGRAVHSYAKGREYPAAGFPLSDDLRGVFLREGWAEEIDPADPVVTSAQEPAASADREVKPSHTVGGAKRIISPVAKTRRGRRGG